MPEPRPTLKWLPAIGRMKSYRRAFFSRFPLVVAALAIPAVRRTLEDCLSQNWDAIVLDNYATAWALKGVLKSRRERRCGVVVHVSHNHEGALARSLTSSFRGSFARKLILLINSFKIEYWEKQIISQADIISTITEEDGIAIRPICRPNARLIVLTPGYSGHRILKKDFSKSARRVVLVGSFRWIVKQENLMQLLAIADGLFHENGITLDVVGEVPVELMENYRGRLLATVFHGFVEDYMPIFNAARLAIVPEIIGGGFKLKILDYIFCGLPVAALTQASAGLPQAIRNNFITAHSLEGLIQEIIKKVDQIGLLERMQSSAADAAADQFNWSDRGQALRGAILGQLSAQS